MRKLLLHKAKRLEEYDICPEIKVSYWEIPFIVDRDFTDGSKFLMEAQIALRNYVRQQKWAWAGADGIYVVCVLPFNRVLVRIQIG